MYHPYVSHRKKTLNWAAHCPRQSFGKAALLGGCTIGYRALGRLHCWEAGWAFDRLCHQKQTFWVAAILVAGLVGGCTFVRLHRWTQSYLIRCTFGGWSLWKAVILSDFCIRHRDFSNLCIQGDGACRKLWFWVTLPLGGSTVKRLVQLTAAKPNATWTCLHQLILKIKSTNEINKLKRIN